MEKTPEKIKEKLKILPEKPGVYLMKNSSGKIIYVGKSKFLKNRIRSYFTSSKHDTKTEELVSHIADFEYIITGTEAEALILENNLIKKHKPKYNIFLRDDKQYPFIKIAQNEPFPRIFVTRQIIKDGSRYFGPYTKAGSIRKILRMLEWIFPFRTCNRNIPDDKVVFEKACINFQLGKCNAPCIGNISKSEYNKIIKNIIHFLKGRNELIVENLLDEMKMRAEKLEFEKAAQIRDKIQSIQKLNNSQTMYFSDLKNRDVIGVYAEGNKAAVSVLKILSGKLLNKEIYALENAQGNTDSQLMEAFLKQYYADKIDLLPYRIIVQTLPEDHEVLSQWLRNKFVIPQRGEMKALVVIAKENAFNYVEEQKLRYMRKSSRTVLPIIELKDKLGLKKLPRKMICLDISTIQGTDTVSSIVFFENGKPKKKNYRHFIIKTVSGQDDFASMMETLNRYFDKIEEQEKPDLIVIDGGKGQLSSAYSVMKQKNIPDIEMISLAKRLEEVFLPKRSDSIILPRTSSALRLLINIRDEAHRFAISYHRKRRNMRTLTSDLDKIKGIGKETRFLLLKEFGSVERIKKATFEELTTIKKIGSDTANRIIEELREEGINSEQNEEL